jgi:hypothetical protein
VGFGCCGYVVSCGFSYGLAESLLCILPVYLGAPYVFLMKFSYLSNKTIGKWSEQILGSLFSINSGN